MDKKLNYETVFDTLVKKTQEYVESNHLKAMILGISGGIDSTVVAAICHEVSKKTGIPLIGRSLPIYKHADATFNESILVGRAFCDDFRICPMTRLYLAALKEVCQVENMERHESTYPIEELEQANGQTKVANGNIQARLRMMFLYNLASIHKGLVISTDNQTEYQLGFWTIHGDVGDFNPLFGLWKTEVYELANYIKECYIECWEEYDIVEPQYHHYKRIVEALDASIKLTPTDGLGISNSDLEQIGAKDYDTVDDILSRFVPFENFRKSYDSAGQIMHPHDEMSESDCWSQLCARHGEDVVNKVWSRHLASEFKRKNLPVVIERELYI